MRVVVLALLAGCGRCDFDAQPASDGFAIDAPADAAVDAPVGTTLVSFGEMPSATHQLVTRDTFLNGNSIGHNYGGEPSISVADAHTALLAFDISALPPGTIVVGATIQVTATTDLTVPIEVYEVIEAWNEGTKTGGSGQANWTERLAGAVWTTAGARAPGSRNPTVVATAGPAAAGTRIAISLDAAGVAAIQRWIDDPAMNHGFAIDLVGQPGWLVVSREGPTMTSRPLLELAVR